MQQTAALELVVLHLDKARKAKKRALKTAERKEKAAEESGWTAQIARKPEGWTSWKEARNELKEQGQKAERSELDFGLLYLSTCCRLQWKEEEEDTEEEEEDEETFLRRRKGLVFYRSPSERNQGLRPTDELAASASGGGREREHSPGDPYPDRSREQRGPRAGGVDLRIGVGRRSEESPEDRLEEGSDS